MPKSNPAVGIEGGAEEKERQETHRYPRLSMYLHVGSGVGVFGWLVAYRTAELGLSFEITTKGGAGRFAWSCNRPQY